MASQAIESQGVQIKRGDGGGPETFTLVPEVTRVDGPSGSAAVIDVTSLDSTAKEKLMGLHDEGQITLEMNYLPADAQHQGLQDDRTNRTKRNFEVVFTDAGNTKLSFAAYVLNFNISSQVDDKVTAACTLEITGQVTRS